MDQNKGFLPVLPVLYSKVYGGDPMGLGLFWGLGCPWRLLCDPETGHKFPLGQKHYQIGLTMRQEDGQQKAKIEELIIRG